MTTLCREGHPSDEPDYCSVCGAPIPNAHAHAHAHARVPGAAAAMPVPRASHANTKPPLSSSVSVTCPSCGELRDDPDARFCEVCRYDFLERRPGPPPVARAQAPAAAPAAPTAPTPSPSASASASAAPSPSPSAPAGHAWELVITVDPALDTDPDADHPCPSGAAPIVVPVDKGDLLVGRHDDTRAIHPEISLPDPGASRRHAKFVTDPDGAVALQDLASTNGTQLNGKDVPPGARQRLAEGDSVTLGRWTRITLRGRA